MRIMHLQAKKDGNSDGDANPNAFRVYTMKRQWKFLVWYYLVAVIAFGVCVFVLNDDMTVLKQANNECSI